MRHIIKHLNANQKINIEVTGLGFSVNEIAPFNAKVYYLIDHKNETVNQLIGRNIKFSRFFKTFTIINTEEYPVDVDFYIMENEEDFKNLIDPSQLGIKRTDTDSILTKSNNKILNIKAYSYAYLTKSYLHPITGRSEDLIYIYNRSTFINANWQTLTINKKAYLFHMEFYATPDPIQLKIFYVPEDYLHSLGASYFLTSLYPVGLRYTIEQPAEFNRIIVTKPQTYYDIENETRSYPMMHLITFEPDKRISIDYTEIGLIPIPPKSAIAIKIINLAGNTTSWTYYPTFYLFDD